MPHESELLAVEFTSNSFSTANTMRAYFCAIDPLLYDALCLSCHLSFYSCYNNYGLCSSFSGLPVDRHIEGKRQMFVTMRPLRRELRKATAGLKQTSPARSPSRPRTMRHVAPYNIPVYMCMISPSVHPAYRVRCSIHTPAALSFRNPRDNAKQQHERDAWKFSRELLREAAQLSPFVYLAFPQIQRVCKTVHASTYLYLSFSLSLSLSLFCILSIILLPWSVMFLTLMQPLISTRVLFIVG